MPDGSELDKPLYKQKNISLVFRTYEDPKRCAQINFRMYDVVNKITDVVGLVLICFNILMSSHSKCAPFHWMQVSSNASHRLARDNQRD